jgi:hypothetical protein
MKPHHRAKPISLSSWDTLPRQNLITHFPSFSTVVLITHYNVCFFQISVHYKNKHIGERGARGGRYILISRRKWTVTHYCNVTGKGVSNSRTNCGHYFVIITICIITLFSLFWIVIHVHYYTTLPEVLRLRNQFGVHDKQVVFHHQLQKQRLEPASPSDTASGRSWKRGTWNCMMADCSGMWTVFSRIKWDCAAILRDVPSKACEILQIF